MRPHFPTSGCGIQQHNTNTGQSIRCTRCIRTLSNEDHTTEPPPDNASWVTAPPLAAVDEAAQPLTRVISGCSVIDTLTVRIPHSTRVARNSHTTALHWTYHDCTAVGVIHGGEKLDFPPDHVLIPLTTVTSHPLSVLRRSPQLL